MQFVQAHEVEGLMKIHRGDRRSLQIQSQKSQVIFSDLPDLPETFSKSPTEAPIRGVCQYPQQRNRQSKAAKFLEPIC